MKRKDLLIPLAMLALGAGIGFWTRERSQPMSEALASATDETGAVDADKAMRGTAVPQQAKSAAAPVTVAAQRDPTFAETKAQAARELEAPLPPLDAKVADVYQQLQARALRGDGRAACRLAVELQQCADRDVMLEGADSAAQLLNEKGPPKDGQAKNSEQRRLQMAQHQIDYAFELDERCKGVDDTQMAELSALWRRAALTGHVPSMLYYARGDGFRMRETLGNLEQLAQYKRDAERLLRAAAAAGSVQAAQQLMSAYMSERGPWSIAPNRLEALTMMELAKLRDYAPHSGPQEAERWNRNSSFVEGAGVRFTTDEWAEAKERAARLDENWQPADDSSGQRRSLWERAEYARASCNQDRFTTPP